MLVIRQQVWLYFNLSGPNDVAVLIHFFHFSSNVFWGKLFLSLVHNAVENLFEFLVLLGLRPHWTKCVAFGVWKVLYIALWQEE